MSDSSIWNLPRRFSPTVLLESHTRRFGIKVVDIVQRCRQIVRFVIVRLVRRLNEKLFLDCQTLRFCNYLVDFNQCYCEIECFVKYNFTSSNMILTRRFWFHVVNFDSPCRYSYNVMLECQTRRFGIYLVDLFQPCCCKVRLVDLESR